MNIRKMSKEDLPQLTEVFLRSYPDEWQKEQALAYLSKFYNFEPEHCYVALEESNQAMGAILGYSYFRGSNQVLFIQELFVDPNARHKGIARDLVTKFRSDYTKAKVKVTPLVNAPTSVLNFYNSMGFEKFQTFSFYDDMSG